MNKLNNPTEIAGCILWLDGADKASMRQNYNDVGANVSDGNRVGYWGDKSGNLPVTNFTNWQTTKRPTYVESVSSLRFASVFSTSLSALGNLSNLNPTTIFIVTAPHALATAIRIFSSAAAGIGDHGGNVNCYIPCYIPNSSGDVSSSANSTNLSTVTFTALSSFHLFVNRNTQATNGVLNTLNGNPGAAGSYTTQVARTCFKIGGSILNGTTGADGPTFYSGYIAEIIIYNSSLDSVNYTRVSNYLNNKWNPVQYIPKQIFALKSGNWSDTDLWNTSAYSAPFNQPLLGDTVYTNNFTVTANSSTSVGTIRNSSLVPNINAGGSFVLANGISLSANIDTCITNVCLISSFATTKAELYGTVGPSLVTAAGHRVIVHSGSGVFKFNGPAINHTTGNPGSSNLLDNTESGTIEINRNVFANLGTGSSTGFIRNVGSGKINFVGNIGSFTRGAGILTNESTGTINLTGTPFGGSMVGGFALRQNGNGIVNVFGTIINNIYSTGGGSVDNQNGRLNIIGDVYSSSSAQETIRVQGGSLSLSGNCYASNLENIIVSTTSTPLSVYGNIINAPNGRQAIYAPRYQVFLTGLPTYTKHAVNGYDKFVYYYTGDTVFVPPLSTNVLQGVTYNFGTLTGAMIVPAITAVNAGTKVGTEIGSAYLSVSDFWNEPLSAIQINSNTIGEYMKKTLTVNSLSSVLNSLDFSKL